MHVKASRAVFWSLFSYKELKRTTKPFSGHALCCFLIGDEKILACKVWRCEESKILRYLLGLKVTQESWLFHFALSPALFFYFSCLIFFFYWAFSWLHFSGKGFFGKAFTIRWRKGTCRWVLEQDCSWFLGQCYNHEFLIFSLVSLTEPCSFWYGLKDLFILHRLVDNVVLNYSNWWHHNW